MPTLPWKIAVDVAVSVPTVRLPMEEVAVTRPPLRMRSVDVALAPTPPHVVGVQAKAPPPAPVASVPQMMLPSTSVSNAWLQLATVESLMPPPVTMRPLMVEVAVVERRVTSTPPAKVEVAVVVAEKAPTESVRSEEHTSELQSHVNLVC